MWKRGIHSQPDTIGENCHQNEPLERSETKTVHYLLTPSAFMINCSPTQTMCVFILRFQRDKVTV